MPHFGLKPAAAERASALIFLLPSLTGFILFYAYPFAIAAAVSFRTNGEGGGAIGLDHYATVLGSESFLLAARNSAQFGITGVTLSVLLALLIALALNRKLPLRRWLRSAFVLPLAVPAASVVLLWRVLLEPQGIVNGWLAASGLRTVDWMESRYAFAVLTAVFLWKTAGYNVVLFLAALQQVPRELHEAAQLDGAGAIRRFRSVTAVHLAPAGAFVVLLTTASAFKVFREAYFVAGPYPHESIYLLQHYMNNLFGELDLAKLAAAACLMAAGMLAVSAALLGTERRIRGGME